MQWMTRSLAALGAAFMVAGPAAAQSPRDSVLAVVNEFFRAMTANDSAATAKTLRRDGQYYSVRQLPESLSIRRTTHEQYITRTGASKDRYLERMWNPTVLIHGPIAVVWTSYDFHNNGKFSHCGVDAFNLVRHQDGWKIVGITYTVEPTGCAPSPLGPLKAPD